MVMNAQIAEMSAIDTAINPRFTHPKTVTGVKYNLTMRAGATIGNAICLVRRSIFYRAPTFAITGSGQRCYNGAPLSTVRVDSLVRSILTMI
jgi:hypothetical protein